MSENTLLWVAIFVFAMLAIGLALTILEFRYGQPRREAEEARRNDHAGNDGQLSRSAR